jgi:hypothetical protein
VIRHRLPEPFYLYGGDLSRNKNLALLVRTYATEAGGRDIFLAVVIVGSDGQKLKALVRWTGPTAEAAMRHATLRGWGPFHGLTKAREFGGRHWKTEYHG